MALVLLLAAMYSILKINHFILMIHSLSTAVEIGLQQTTYTISEDDGTLTICAQITTGELERQVVVNFTTIDNTATSTG